jgi:hypothetical protein
MPPSSSSSSSAAAAAKEPFWTHSLPQKVLIEKKNSEALVRKRTIPTERPPLVGEVSATFVV